MGAIKNEKAALVKLDWWSDILPRKAFKVVLKQI